MNNTNSLISGDNKARRRRRRRGVGPLGRAGGAGADLPACSPPCPAAPETCAPCPAAPRDLLSPPRRPACQGAAAQFMERWAAAQAASGARGSTPLVAAFCQANVGDTSPNTRGPACLDTGLPCDAVHSTCGGRVQRCVGRGPGWPDHFESTRIIGRKQVGFVGVSRVSWGLGLIHAHHRPEAGGASATRRGMVVVVVVVSWRRGGGGGGVLVHASVWRLLREGAAWVQVRRPGPSAWGGVGRLARTAAANSGLGQGPPHPTPPHPIRPARRPPLHAGGRGTGPVCLGGGHAGTAGAGAVPPRVPGYAWASGAGGQARPGGQGGGGCANPTGTRPGVAAAVQRACRQRDGGGRGARRPDPPSPPARSPPRPPAHRPATSRGRA